MSIKTKGGKMIWNWIFGLDFIFSIMLRSLVIVLLEIAVVFHTQEEVDRYVQEFI